MFISKVEKLKLISSMMDLTATVHQLDTEIIFLKAKLKTLEGKTPEAKKPRKKHIMSPETRARMSQMMKERHAKNKQEKQNATSISTTSV